MDNLADKLLEAVDEKENPSVVGLDPKIEYLPSCIKQKYASRGDPFECVKGALTEFGKKIIEGVSDIVPAIKIQIAFYEQYGSRGFEALEETIECAKKNGLFVICDGKRNDIGSTSEAYANGYLGKVDLIDRTPAFSFGADMLTINGYLGLDSLSPFVDTAKKYGKGVFILVKTSNPSSGDIQDKKVGSKRVYEIMAEHVKKLGSSVIGKRGYSPIGAVVGATYPRDAEKLRKIMKKNLFLVPGFGAQGGSASDVAHCFNDDGYGALVNSSRGILLAYKNERYKRKFGEEKFDLAAREAAVGMRKDVISALNNAHKLPEHWHI